MMSRNSLYLCIGYTLYLILGAAMFMFLEYEVTEQIEVKEPQEWTRLKELALMKEKPGDKDVVLSLTRWLPKACGAIVNRTLRALSSSGSQEAAVQEVEAACPHLHQENVTEVVSYPWDFINALYFSMTVTTTIGYGHISPTQAGGRIVCILYSLVGIPLTGILLAWTSESFGELLFRLFKSKIDKEKHHSHLMIGLATTVYIAMGFLVFIVLPGAVFMALEDWTYLEGIYYAYITLTTIGFGDFVSGKHFEGASLYVYQIVVILWIMVGLGYWVMVASFITKALQSERLQTSLARSAEEIKKLMHQMGIKNHNHDPTFLRQHSKATLNLMLQLSNILAVQGGAENVSDSPEESSSATTGSTGPSSPSSPPLSPFTIPGISTLFGPGFSRTTPLSHLMGPLREEYVVSQTPPASPQIFKSRPVLTKESAFTFVNPEMEMERGVASLSEDEDQGLSSPNLRGEPGDSVADSPSESVESTFTPSLHHHHLSESQVKLTLEEEPGS